MIDTIFHVVLVLAMPPLLLGVIGKTKAAFAGRVGAPFLQPYYDMARLMKKGIVLSDSTTWIFRAGPVVTLAATLFAALLVPLGKHPAPVSFEGDMILFAYLFALGRFFTTTAALDTASSFEGMGAAREVSFSCLAEPTLFFALITLTRLSGTMSLTPMLQHVTLPVWMATGASLLLLLAGLFVVLLAENCRIPFDDPNTHLELTMIHEVMVLDHSGPYFSCVLYGAALKLYLLGALFVNIALPFASGNPYVDWVVFAAGMLLLAVAIGVVESVMARLRLIRVPQLLVAALILTAFSLVLVVR
ncbi:NADH-quinone oxidoreductase subunit H [Geomonas sp. Red69]|uniref:NADH-quinone oxidoreductase subunit H n=1 Tax=Geomonas diazotrophica TaxID=2843197 RepID=A0ABX8JJ96_9BACT|nr:MULTISPECIES: NADH-quinone oxidoreductase subunit H [Geomonas]MBU5636736.1 NADH-quinone oxidoreductase subunit H [Geomonas diazotrophica]QWV98453.1 NADH-quinone oxidoreductase subunit H [Geomonas nitrogeniifigens]QXE87635.1 NADH-quinone oxidoreductase subunit H [Geomonas nitrogeniifigens]